MCRIGEQPSPFKNTFVVRLDEKMAARLTQAHADMFAAEARRPYSGGRAHLCKSSLVHFLLSKGLDAVSDCVDAIDFESFREQLPFPQTEEEIDADGRYETDVDAHIADYHAREARKASR